MKHRCEFVLIPVLVLFLSNGLAAPADTSADDDTTYERRIVRVYYEEIDDIRALNEYDLLEYNNREERYVLVAIDSTEQARLQENGYRVEIDSARTEEIFGPRIVPAGQETAIPGFPCYRTVEETYAMAQQIVADHPDLATWIDAGDSWEKLNGIGGYDLQVLRFTNSAIPGPKPKLFITGSIHAREYAPAELLNRFAEDLATRYDLSADITWLLDYHEIHLALLANPDGRKKAEAGLFWRKNTNQNYCSPTSNNRGADLNRNFEFEWGCCGGASNNPCNDLYRGPSAATEPEVQTIQDYLRAEFPDQKGDVNDPAPSDATGIYMDIHASGQLVLWPWGFGGNAPNLPALTTFGRKLAYFNGYQPQQAIELYATDGTTIDFGYGELGVATMAYELGTSIFQDCGTFENVILQDNLPSLLYAAKVARTPYLTPAGPDVLQAIATPGIVQPGETLDLTATVDDTRFNNQNGVEPTQSIAAAQYYLDLPPWASGSPAPVSMFAADGDFDSEVEPVTVPIDTSGLNGGRHIVFVRGRDQDGNWGAPTAAFFTVLDPNDDDGDGVTNGADCEPGDPTVWAPPTPALDLTVTKNATDNLYWLPPEEPGADLPGYDVLRSDGADDFMSATCIGTGGPGTVATDTSVPASGNALYYLIRSKNRCGTHLGYDSTGEPRTGILCTF